MNEHPGSRNRASSSGTTAISQPEISHAGPRRSHTAFTADWCPTDGRYGSLLDDVPTATTYDPLQHHLLEWALGDWARPTDLAPAPGVAEWQPVVDDVVSPFPLRASVPVTQAMPQQPQPQRQGDRTSQPKRARPKNGYVDYPDDLPDKQIFSDDPNHIAYGNLLRLSTRYTNSEIFEHCNKDRKRPVFASQAFINNRITAAMKWAVENWDMSYDDVAVWLDREKVKNGLPPRQKNKRNRGQDKRWRTVQTNQGERVYAEPSKHINATDTILTSQQQHFLHPQLQRFLQPVRDPLTPAQQTATSVPSSALPTPAATPNSAMNTSGGQKKRKCTDNEQTHTLVTGSDGRIADMPSKSRTTGEAMSNLGTHTSWHSVQASPTPAQQAATSMQHSTLLTPTATPGSTKNTSGGQKKRKRTDDEQTHPLKMDQDSNMLAPPSKRLNIGEAMPPPQAHAFSQLVQAICTPAHQTVKLAQHATPPPMSPPQADAFLQLKQALSTSAQQTANLVAYAVTPSPMATTAGLARTAAIQEAAMLTPPKTALAPESDDIYKFRGVSVLDDYRHGGILAVNLGRVDLPRAPAYSVGSAWQPVVIDLTGDD